MNTDDRKIQEFENNFKTKLFDIINGLNSDVFGIINKNSKKLVDIKIEIPNVAITLNNKIVELSHEFHKSGISMFSHKYDDLDIVASSILGDAILHDLIDLFQNSYFYLKKYTEIVEGLSKKRIKKINNILDSNINRRFVKRFNYIIRNEEYFDFSIKDDEKDRLYNVLNEYKASDSKISNYSLYNNVCDSIVKEITSSYSSFETGIGILEQYIIPDLKKLGLEDLIVDIRKSLIEEYMILISSKQDKKYYRR